MLKLLIAAFLTFSSAVAAASPPALVYSVAAAKGADECHITLTVTNKGNITAKLLKDPRGTLSTLPTDAFRITHNETGKAPEFHGAIAKYVPEVAAKIGQEDAFIVIKAGESVTVTHDLAEVYNFTSSGKGTYAVQPGSHFYYIDDSGAPIQVSAPAQTTHITVTSTSARRSAEAATVQARAPSFVGCVPHREASLLRTIPRAQDYVWNAWLKLDGPSQRYVTWFGAYNNARRITIRNNYVRMLNTGFEGFAYDCSCTNSGLYAYVFPSRPTTIFLCGAFWSAPVIGTDSKAGTLVHESSHFYIHAATRDYAYGQERSLALARDNPSQAAANADSYEYFAENRPYLSKEDETEGEAVPLEDEDE